MTTLHMLDASQTGLEASFIKYKKRCEIILIKVFDRQKVDTRNGLVEWLTVRYEDSPNKALFMHEDPFNRVASYLEYPRWGIPLEYIESATKLAREMGSGRTE